jgi:hypothetical protein
LEETRRATRLPWRATMTAFLKKNSWLWLVGAFAVLIVVGALTS